MESPQLIASMTQVAARGGGGKPCRLKEGVIPHPSHPTNADAFNVATRLLCRTVGTRGEGAGRVKYRQNLLHAMAFYYCLPPPPSHF